MFSAGVFGELCEKQGSAGGLDFVLLRCKSKESAKRVMPKEALGSERLTEQQVRPLNGNKRQRNKQEVAEWRYANDNENQWCGLFLLKL